MNESALCSILYISQYYPPETGAGPTRAKELSTKWSELGHDVTVLTSSPDYPEGEVYDGYDNRLIRVETIEGVRVISLKTIPASNKRFVRRGIKFIWFMIAATIAGIWIERHDVVISTAPQPLTGPAGWFVARLKGASFVYEVRDLWPESIISLSQINEKYLIPLTWVIKFTYRHADRLVVVSPGFVPVLVEYGVDSADILVHYNGVSPELFEVDDEYWSLKEEIVNRLRDEFVISYVGTLGRAHGLSVILDAAEELPDVTFLLVGTGAEAADLRNGAEQRGLDNILFAGRHPKCHVPEFLALSDLALVHLKDRELFRTAVPSKLFEAMAAGLPVLLGVRGEAERILNQNGAGVAIPPEDAEAIVEAVTCLRQDESRRKKLGQNGQNAVQESFSWSQIAVSYSSDLQALVNKSSSRAA